MTIQEGDLLWTPSPALVQTSQLARFMHWLREHRSLDFADYAALWQWSVDFVEDFWEALWQYFEIDSSAPYTSVLNERVMPGAVWFPGARVNFHPPSQRDSPAHNPELGASA
jgi:acetoacetyl-CoA synthetase